ncbi:MAG: hypothetical protein D6753_15970 [Planctomycetota bacterium]|nr:MAG: hypothetical protein D6753_15970 [Planctomycetota bacterium]
MQRRASTRGAVFEDFDQDGRLDAIVLNCDDTAQVLRNLTSTSNASISIRCIGRATNRDAVGARITIRSAGSKQSAEVRSGRGYQSHCGTQIHFGLGRVPRVDEIEVLWPDGTVTRWQPPAGFRADEHEQVTTRVIIQEHP